VRSHQPNRFALSGRMPELLHLVARNLRQLDNGWPVDRYVFNRKTLRALSDASGGTLPRSCASPAFGSATGATDVDHSIQAGEGPITRAARPPITCTRHGANPTGRSLLYDFSKAARGVVNTNFAKSTPHTVYFPPGVPPGCAPMAVR